MPLVLPFFVISSISKFFAFAITILLILIVIVIIFYVSHKIYLIIYDRLYNNNIYVIEEDDTLATASATEPINHPHVS